MLWFGVDDSGTSCLTPIYTSSTRVPECFREGNGHLTEYSTTSAFWLFNRVTNFAYLRYDLISEDIKRVIHETEDRNMAEIPAVDAAAEMLYKQNPELAVDFLTDYSVRTAQKMFDRWTELDRYLLVKYMDGNVKKEKDGQFEDNGNGRHIPAMPDFPATTKHGKERWPPERATGSRWSNRNKASSLPHGNTKAAARSGCRFPLFHTAIPDRGHADRLGDFSCETTCNRAIHDSTFYLSSDTDSFRRTYTFSLCPISRRSGKKRKRKRTEPPRVKNSIDLTKFATE